jgi:LacI family transcriptional regulator
VLRVNDPGEYRSQAVMLCSPEGKDVPKPTIHDVAQQAGVSIATVSRALSGTRNVAPEIVARVTKAADAIGYRPNALAQALRRQETMTIGVVVPGISNPFFGSVIDALEQELDDTGRDLLLCDSRNDPSVEARRVQALVNRRVDALILVPCDASRSTAAVIEATKSTPVLQLDRVAEGVRTDSVSVDDGQGIFALLEHLTTRGAKRVHFVSARPTSSTAARRLSSFTAGCRELGLRSWPKPALGTFSIDWGAEATRNLLTKATVPDVIVCGDDAIALGVLQALRETNLVVPHDIRVTGFDDIDLASMSNPPLTTIRQPTAELAHAAVALLERRLTKPRAAARSVLIKPTLAIRRSTA